ncbi:MAG TPA: response regulator [bacterium]|nr:response regulator [bacterium]HQP97670.1 response regulator [bacterium]
MARILIVDDSYFMRMVLRSMLKREKHEVLEAEDGDKAVCLYRENRPELVTLDITMPVKDGIEAAREILQEDPSAKIIMVTALGQESIMKKAISLGIREFVVKPFTTERVREAVNRILK